MKFIEFLKELPSVFDWYFKLHAIKRIQLNYIVLIFIIMSLTYFNDKLHRETIASLTLRIDTINDSRSADQEKYAARMEYYTEKFNGLLEILLIQEKRIERLKNDS